MAVHQYTRRQLDESRPPMFLTTAVVLLALVAAACGDDGTETIRLSQDSPDLTPEQPDSADTDRGSLGTVGDLEFLGLDGTERTTGEYAGRPLVINFFAAWCPSCVAEMPHFEAVFDDLGGEVAFLGLSQDATTTDAEGLVADTGVTYDIGWDPDLEVFGAFGGYAMPTTVFVDTDGRVVEVFAGALNEEALRQKVEAIRA